nr:hypothetical protein [Micromonospora sp. DSM 115978]
VEKRFKVDDAVGAVAVHGYCGFLALVIAGFMMWGYPAAPPIDGDHALFTNAEGWPIVNPLGQLIGAIIMFVVLGFLPTYGVAKLLDKFGLLRVPREIELAGLDANSYGDAYPDFAVADEADLAASVPAPRTSDEELASVAGGGTAREDRSS